jgi:hypothetical protein
VIKRAAIDAAFRERLLEDRGKAVREIGLKLTLAEGMVLASVPKAQLQTMIDRMQVSDQERHVMLAQTPPGNKGPSPTPPATLGIRPESQDRPSPPPRTRGIRPDLPQRDPRPPQTKGIRPDED